MIAKVLMIFSASIILILGILHLVYTFWGPKLTPRDAALQVSMGQISPVITKETTMWRAWVGFNASHSMGAILFGLIYGYLAIAHSQLLFQSPFLLTVGMQSPPADIHQFAWRRRRLIHGGARLRGSYLRQK